MVVHDNNVLFRFFCKQQFFIGINVLERMTMWFHAAETPLLSFLLLICYIITYAE